MLQVSVVNTYRTGTGPLWGLVSVEARFGHCAP